MIIVRLKDNISTAWGEFATMDDASEFAKFVTDEIDPAYATIVSRENINQEALFSPLREMLNWRRSVMCERDKEGS